MKLHHVLAALVCSAALACESKPEAQGSDTTAANDSTTAAAERSDEPPAEPATEPASQAETATADSWLAVPEDELNPAQKAQLERARAAQKELGGSLVKALAGSIGEKGLPASIGFCKEQAPKITSTVAESRGVGIGRTSKRLRNPENTGPQWVPNAREQAAEKAMTFAGPNGELGLIAPIMTAELCTKCHGTPDTIPTEVATAIDEAYPNDAARGFAEGDLRGWFWVEVPPPS
jgi:hypothetical protein